MSKKKILMICGSQVAAVFAGPSATSVRVGQLWRGQEVAVLEANGDWAWITQPEGWVVVGHLKDAPVDLEEGKHKNS